MNGGHEEPETYDGPLELHHGGTSIEARAHLSGYFQPIDGTYRWQGRIDPDESVDGLAAGAGRKPVEVSLPGRARTTAKLAEPNPWGGYRIAGRGTPPFH